MKVYCRVEGPLSHRVLTTEVPLNGPIAAVPREVITQQSTASLVVILGKVTDDAEITGVLVLANKDKLPLRIVEESLGAPMHHAAKELANQGGFDGVS